MTDDQKVLIDEFVKNSQSDANSIEEFNLVLDKLNEFLMPFFEHVVKDNNNLIFFKNKVIGDYKIGSNYEYYDFCYIMFEVFYANENDLEYNNSRQQKSEIGKLLSDSFNFNNNVLPTTTNLQNALFKYLVLKGSNFKVFMRKNYIYLKFLDYKFCLFFNAQKASSSEVNFNLKGKTYNFNLDLMNKNLLEKNEKTNGHFFNLIKFFKVIEKELTLINKLEICAGKNLYFYENLLYNIPNELLNNNVYDDFMLSYNYILTKYKQNKLDEFVDGANLKLIDDNYKLFAKHYITTQDVKLVLKNCRNFINNQTIIFSDNNQDNDN